MQGLCFRFCFSKKKFVALCFCVDYDFASVKKTSNALFLLVNPRSLFLLRMKEDEPEASIYYNLVLYFLNADTPQAKKKALLHGRRFSPLL